MSPTDRTWQPTGTSVAVSSGITLLVVLVLTWRTDGVVVPIALGALGAVTFAGSCWALSLDGDRTVVAPVVSLLTLPTAIGLFGSTAVVVVSLSGDLFPVEDGSLVSVTALIVAGHAGVVLGSTVAILGLLVGARNTIGGRSLERYSRSTVLTGVVPTLGAVLLVLDGLVFEGAGPIGYGGAVTRSALTILVAVAILAFLSAVVSVVVRRIARNAPVDFAEVGGPLVGGLLITVVAVIVADPVYHTVVEAVVEPLPDTLGAEFYETSNAATEMYGEETFVVLLTLGSILATATFVLSLRLARFLGYLSPGWSGYSLASSGLFVGTVSAATIGAPAWLVFGGVLSSMLVWDAGQFATTLGREIGHGADTRGVELTHVGASLLVGVGGVLVATAVSSVAEDSVVLSPVTPVALLFVATGLVFLVAAVR